MDERALKRLRKLEQNPKSASPKEVRSALEAFGYELARQTGSHQTFTRAGEYPIVVPIHRPHIKAVYVRKVIQRLRAQVEGSEEER
jgi:predicted RNA binding protein YcfA (HicA-like mRNA interferase family)